MTLHTAPAAIRSSAERIGQGFALALGGSLLLAISAKVQVPFYPVPLTLQTLVVLLLGATLGARLAAASVALYLIEGLAGLPVFAGAVAGPVYMAGPTGGFLVGFLAAAALIGFAADRRWDRTWIRLLGSLSLGPPWCSPLVFSGSRSLSARRRRSPRVSRPSHSRRSSKPCSLSRWSALAEVRSSEGAAPRTGANRRGGGPRSPRAAFPSGLRPIRKPSDALER